MRLEFEELELPFDGPAEEEQDVADERVAEVAEAPVCQINRDPLGTFPCCPMCGGEMRPEHAHYRCSCGWRDSCCD